MSDSLPPAVPPTALIDGPAPDVTLPDPDAPSPWPPSRPVRLPTAAQLATQSDD